MTRLFRNTLWLLAAVLLSSAGSALATPTFGIAMADPHQFLGLRLQVILYPDFVDQVELGRQPIDVFLFGLQDFVEQVATNVVLVIFAIRDCFAKIRYCAHLHVQVAFENLRNILTNSQFSEILQIWQAFEKQNSLNQ